MCHMPNASPAPIEPLGREAFLTIIEEHSNFWDDDLTYQLHHPMFIEEFGDTAFAIRDGDEIVAYLLGFYSQTSPTAYIHMVAVRKGHRGMGHARRLYEHFIDAARKKACTILKATASPFNEKSIRFHQALGMTMLGEDFPEAVAGVKVVKDYLRRGSHRVVFELEIM